MIDGKPNYETQKIEICLTYVCDHGYPDGSARVITRQSGIFIPDGVKYSDIIWALVANVQLASDKTGYKAARIAEDVLEEIKSNEKERVW